MKLEQIGATGEQERLNIGAKGNEANRLERTKGNENRKSIAATGDQAVRKVDAEGAQARETQNNKRENEIALRQDARGQTGRQGAKFFG